MAVQTSPQTFTSTLDPEFSSQCPDEAVAHDTGTSCRDRIDAYVDESGRFTTEGHAVGEKQRLFEFLKHMLLVDGVAPPGERSVEHHSG